MDRFRIEYKCIKVPKPSSGLEGFEEGKSYVGRSFNGFFEVASSWGSGKQTKLISKAYFEEHFELVGVPQVVEK